MMDVPASELLAYPEELEILFDRRRLASRLVLRRAIQSKIVDLNEESIFHLSLLVLVGFLKLERSRWLLWRWLPVDLRLGRFVGVLGGASSPL